METLFNPAVTLMSHQGLKGLLKDLHGGYGVLSNDGDLYDLLNKDFSGAVHIVLTDEGPIKEIRLVSTLGLHGGIITLSNGLTSLKVVSAIEESLRDYSDARGHMDQGSYILDQMSKIGHLYGCRSTLKQLMIAVNNTAACFRNGTLSFKCLDKRNRPLTIVFIRKYGNVLVRVNQDSAGTLFTNYKKFSKWCLENLSPVFAD